jgi:hypothetical protein
MRKKTGLCSFPDLTRLRVDHIKTRDIGRVTALTDMKDIDGRWVIAHCDVCEAPRAGCRAAPPPRCPGATSDIASSQPSLSLRYSLRPAPLRRSPGASGSNEPEAVCQAATSALTRLFEQRLDESSELVPLDGIARTRRAWWGADAHGFAAGDQTRPLSYRPGIRRVRFRCPLPSAFMT